MTGNNLFRAGPGESKGSGGTVNFDMAVTLADRGNTHGDFREQSICFDDLMRVVNKNNPNLSPVQKHGITMIMLKASRILTGDPDFADHWHDIAGYANKVEENLPVKS